MVLQKRPNKIGFFIVILIASIFIFKDVNAAGLTVGNGSLNLLSGENLYYGVTSASNANGNFLLLEKGPGNTVFKIDYNGNITTNGSLLGSNSYWNLSGNNLFASSTSWNLGIGTTAPSALLDVANKLKFTSGGTIYNTDNGRWLDLSGVLGDSLRVSGNIITTGGNVGIGTTNPIERLDIDSKIRLGYNSPTYGIGIAAAGVGHGGWARQYGFTTANGTTLFGGFGAFGDQDNLQTWWIGNGYSDYAVSFTKGTNVANFTGNVGIGTTAPAQKLDVNGNILADRYIGDNGYWGIAINGIGGSYADMGILAPDLQAILYTPTGTKNVIIPSGSVGIGTTAPNYKLDVNGDGNFRSYQIHNVGTPSQGSDAATKSYVDSAMSGGSGATVGYWAMNGANIYNSNSGNVGIGITNPSQKLEVHGNIAADSIRQTRPEFDIAQGCSVTVSGGTLNNGGPTYRNINSAWTITAVGQVMTLNCGGWWHTGISFAGGGKYETTGNKMPGGFTIEKSSDGGTTWTNVSTVTNNVNSSYDVDLADAPMVRITVNSFQSGETQARISALKLYQMYPYAAGDPFGYTGTGNVVQMGSNVGIGTTNPGQKLSVDGNISTEGMLVMMNSAVGNQLLLNTSGINFGALQNIGASTWGLGWGSGSVSNTIVGTAISWNTSGSVGIGSTAPAASLDVTSKLRFTSGGTIYNTDSSRYLDMTGTLSDSLKVSGNLVTTGGYIKSNNGIVSSFYQSIGTNWGYYVNTNIPNSSTMLNVSVTGGNSTWNGTFLVQGTNSFTPNDTWNSAKLISWTGYNSGVDDVQALIMSNTATTGYGGTFVVIKSNAIAGGTYATMTVAATGLNVGSISLTSSSGAPYTYTMASSTGTYQIYQSNTGNVGIGTTAPTDKLYVSGNATISGIAGCTGTGSAIKTDASGRLVCGTIAGGVTGSGTTNYVTRWTGAGTLGTGTLYDDGTNVGVGTTAPKRLLNVHGTAAVESGQATTITDATVALKIGPATSRSGAGYYMNGIGFADLWNYNGGSGYDANNHAWIGTYHESTPGSELASLVFATNQNTDNTGLPSERMRITSGGNVGIGNASPSAILDVSNKLKFTSGGTIYNTDSSRWLDMTGVLGDSLKVSGNLITTAGNVGIGTTNPQTKLNVVGKILAGSLASNSGYNSVISLQNNSGEETSLFLWQNGVASGKVGFAANSNTLRIVNTYTDGSINNPAAIDISSTGNVGIGTTDPGTYKLYVNGSAYVNGSLTMADGANLSMPSSQLTVNKLTVNTIDPLYNIKGTNYSSFAASIVGGVKEEVTGKIKINDKVDDEYQAIIDFDKQKSGSDLWVWRSVIDFNKDNVEAIITPYGGFANVYYSISENKFIFHSNQPVEVSYRLIAKRFDWRQWPTKAKNQKEKAGFILK